MNTCGNNTICTGALTSKTQNTTCACLINNGNCSQVCNSTGPGQVSCSCSASSMVGVKDYNASTCAIISCNEGYSYSTSMCVPINNCLISNGGCSQVCNYVSPGSSNCSCYPGYSVAGKYNICTNIDPCSMTPNSCSSFFLNLSMISKSHF